MQSALHTNPLFPLTAASCAASSCQEAPGAGQRVCDGLLRAAKVDNAQADVSPQCNVTALLALADAPLDIRTSSEGSPLSQQSHSSAVRPYGNHVGRHVVSHSSIARHHSVERGSMLAPAGEVLAGDQRTHNSARVPAAPGQHTAAADIGEQVMFRPFSSARFCEGDGVQAARSAGMFDSARSEAGSAAGKQVRRVHADGVSSTPAHVLPGPWAALAADVGVPALPQRTHAVNSKQQTVQSFAMAQGDVNFWREVDIVSPGSSAHVLSKQGMIANGSRDASAVGQVPASPAAAAAVPDAAQRVFAAVHASLQKFAAGAAKQSAAWHRYGRSPAAEAEQCAETHRVESSAFGHSTAAALAKHAPQPTAEQTAAHWRSAPGVNSIGWSDVDCTARRHDGRHTGDSSVAICGGHVHVRSGKCSQQSGKVNGKSATGGKRSKVKQQLANARSAKGQHEAWASSLRGGTPPGKKSWV